MFHRFGVLAAALALLVAGNARADALKPAEAEIVDLGTVNGIVYYTVEPTGYRVVATLRSPDQSPGVSSVVRFVATLAPEQSITLSTPRAAGEPAVEVRFVRHGGHVFVEDSRQAEEGTYASHATAVRASGMTEDGMTTGLSHARKQ